jgi:hypothetical protein
MRFTNQPGGFYGGGLGNDGALANQMAGVSFPIQGGSSIGKPLLPNFKEIKGDKRDPSFPPEENIPRYLMQQAGVPRSSNLPGAIQNMGGIGTVGNMAGIANSTFFEGPQFAQPGSAQELGAEAGRALGSPAVRFNPNELAVPPASDIMQRPGYNPFRLEQGRDRFILHDPRSGVAGVGAPPAGFQGKYVS